MKQLLWLLLLAAISEQAIAAGIAVAPAEIQITTNEAEQQQRTATIYNLGEEELWLAAKAETLLLSYPDKISQNTPAHITITTPKKLKPGNYQETIYVTVSGNTDGVKIATGAAINARITIMPSNNTSILVGLITSAGIAAAGTAAYLGIMRLAERTAETR